MDTFENTVMYKEIKGYYSIDCPKGLWGVSGYDRDKVLAEAQHYFHQYQSDGEYDGTVFDKLFKKYGGK